MTQVHGEGSKGTWDTHRPPRDQETRGLQAISCSGGSSPQRPLGWNRHGVENMLHLSSEKMHTLA